MNIFNRKIKQKHLEQFELKIAELVETELPELKKAIGISKFSNIAFIQNPSAIFILRRTEVKNNLFLH